MIRAVLLAAVLTACAGMPPGVRYANPNCIFRCVVEVVDPNAPMLTQLTTTQGGTGGSNTNSKTTTETSTKSIGGP